MPYRRNIISELMKSVAKAALLTIVPILIQAFVERYLSDEERWENEESDSDQEAE
ncbi:MAG: hypothetical protein L0G80_17405 [Shewanella sp.]|uniref:hypothetical protein n=1 Tax=Shewanella sp. TaxID=50422 RepID=UPI0026479792|nr:hypothetical protein [Shewanella sp.]MDN5501694.1 hypothetical protein [Shewanella sp.]MDN5529573.1 hypothetical protein [Shewanella sp.]